MFGSKTGALWAAIAVLALGALSGCKVTAKAENTKAQARFINLMTDPAKLNVSLDGAQVASDLAYQAATGYSEHHSNTYPVVVTGPGGSTVASHSIGLGQVKSSVFLLGSAAAGSASYLVIGEAPVTVSAGKFVVRMVRLSSNLAAYDLYITAAGADLATATATVAATAVAVPSFPSAEMEAGSYRVRLTNAGAKTVVYDATMNFAAGSDNTLVLYSLGSAAVPTLLWMHPESNQTQSAANPQARLRLVHGGPDVADARLELDGTTAIAATAYASPSAYATVASGSRALRVADATGVVVAGTQELLPGRDYTVVLKGRRAAAATLVFEEDTRNPPLTSARGQFVNASSDGIAVDVADNGTKIVSALAAGARSAAKELTVATHPLSFTAAGGSAALAQVTTEALGLGGLYSYALVGDAGGYRIVSYKLN